MCDKDKLIVDLRERLRDVQPLEGETDFFITSETLCRFLKARDWNIDVAEKAIRATIDYRRSLHPLDVDCKWCHDQPGYHSMRQVGFDELGRPVLYSSFTQTTARKITVEDSIRHVTYLIENAKLTMKPGVTTWVFIIDCTGLSLPLCNPKLGYGVTQVMSNHYPERLGMVICLNHSPVFQGVWRAIKAFLHPTTVAKMLLVRSRGKVQQTFSKYFSEELTQWLTEEIKLNRQKPLPNSQRAFWDRPSGEGKGVHDPRGCPSYVRNFVEPYSEKSFAAVRGLHKPHPTVLDSVREVLRPTEEGLSSIDPPTSPGGDEELTTGTGGVGVGVGGAPADDDASNSEDENCSSENSFGNEVSIDEEFQIPKDALPIGS